MTMFRQLLRSLGFSLSAKSKVATEEDVAQAATENALHDNDQAFEQVAKVYKEVPRAASKLLQAVEKAHTPFSDLENLTRLKNRRDRKGLGL